MGRDYFQFKQFTIQQTRQVMRVNTDAVLLGAWADFAREGHTLDIGTGTGIIALMLAQRGARHVDAIDIEKDAYSQAYENVMLSPWASQIQVVHCAFQLWAESCPTRYDTIVSNPPYFSQSLQGADAARNRARHNDMLMQEDLLVGLSLCMAPGGRFCAVFPLTEGTQFIALAAQEGLYCNRLVSVSSRPNSPTKRILCEFSRESTSTEKRELTIFGPDGAYSPEYRRLTSDFYLAF